MMILDRRGLGALFLSAAVTLVAAPSFAQPSPASVDPRRWVESRLGAVGRLLSQGSDAGVTATATRDAQVARILNGMLDIEELGRRALDPYFAQQTPEDQTEFVRLLRQLIERNYRQNLESTLNWQVTYGVAATAAEGTAVVPTTARSRTNVRTEPVTIDYHLRRRGDSEPRSGMGHLPDDPRDRDAIDPGTDGEVDLAPPEYLEIPARKGLADSAQGDEAHVAALRLRKAAPKPPGKYARAMDRQ